MVTITTERALQACRRRRAFCYLCAKPFIPSDFENKATNSDHVIPFSLPHRLDKSVPLKLETHEQCNSTKKERDTLLAQIVGMKQARYPLDRDRKFDAYAFEVAGSDIPAGAIDYFPMDEYIWEWVRGFHAALYEEPLPETEQHKVFVPFPAGDDPAHPVPPDPLHAILVAAIKRNRAVSCLDRVECYRGRCRYECVWSRSEEGLPICVFGVDAYEWLTLGDIHHFEPRGCVGYYFRPAGHPPEASVEDPTVRPEFSNVHRLDPFGS